MTVNTPGGSLWPSRLAYAAAALFSAASGVTNLLYGIAKGTDFGTSLVWGAVSIAVSIVFALSWPALIISLDRKEWARAVLVLIALIVTGTYSVSAALGSAMDGRTSAAIEQKDAQDRKAKAQIKWNTAKAELDQLTASKPATELQSLIDSAKAEIAKLPASRTIAEIEASLRASRRDPQRYNCAMVNGSMAMSCPKLDVEKARAQQRERLTAKIDGWAGEIGQADQRRVEQREKAQATMDQAAAELAKAGPTKVANADAVALTAYLNGLGMEIDAERVNKLLVLLAVLIVECGGGLALAVGTALGEGQSERTEGTQGNQQVTRVTPGVPSSVTLPTQPQQLHHAFPSVPQRFSGTVEAAFLRMLRERGGQIVAGQRTLGRTLGASATHINRVLAKLSEAGIISFDATRRGSTIRLMVAGTA